MVSHRCFQSLNSSRGAARHCNMGNWRPMWEWYLARRPVAFVGLRFRGIRERTCAAGARDSREPPPPRRSRMTAKAAPHGWRRRFNSLPLFENIPLSEASAGRRPARAIANLVPYVGGRESVARFCPLHSKRAGDTPAQSATA